VIEMPRIDFPAKTLTPNGVELGTFIEFHTEFHILTFRIAESFKECNVRMSWGC
jgi:hypothetical protein